MFLKILFKYVVLPILGIKGIASLVNTIRYSNKTITGKIRKSRFVEI